MESSKGTRKFFVAYTATDNETGRLAHGNLEIISEPGLIGLLSIRAMEKEINEILKPHNFANAVLTFYKELEA